VVVKAAIDADKLDDTGIISFSAAGASTVTRSVTVLEPESAAAPKSTKKAAPAQGGATDLTVLLVWSFWLYHRRRRSPRTV